MTRYSSVASVLLFPLGFITISLLIKYRKKTTGRDFVIHLIYIILLFGISYIDTYFVLALHYILMTSFILMMFIFVGLEKEQELENKQKELAISELNALRLQMNPHFIYNTLASIDALTMVDPEEASDLINKFINHLRNSYLENSPQKVPFETEIENLNYYISVEQTRFPLINVEYDIRSSGFELPPLTIQPFVENAIKHGICGRDNSEGTITIISDETDESYIIKITDNGIGFDQNAPVVNSKRSHIGIQNTTKRLELICNGNVEVTSIENVGTQVKIIIPKENQ